MMEDLQADAEDLGADNDRFEKLIYDNLQKLCSNSRKQLGQELVKAISDCDDGKELSVIFNIHQKDYDKCLPIYQSIHSSLQRELARIGPYNIAPYEPVLKRLSLQQNYIDLEIYCSTPQSDPNITYKLSTVLENSKHFSEVLPIISHASIECNHINTEYSIRINISETCNLHSIQFINQLKLADNRINELMLFLNIWFKTMEIYSNEYMTKYCLMTLIIFYLQNTNPPVLESIKTIQQAAHFGLNLQYIPVNCTQNIHQMIKGFFEFYNSLDFEKVIIAPYLGKLIKKADFESKAFKYPEYEAQMGMLAGSSSEPVEGLDTKSPVCVQDMFYLHRNVADRNINKSLSEHYFKHLKKCISIAHKMCCDSEKSIKNLYKSLLVNVIEELDQKPSVDDSLSFYITPIASELKPLFKFADGPLSLRKLWAKAYIAAIPEIIKIIYKIDIKLLPPTGNFEYKKFEETERMPLPFEWSIRSSLDLWTGRQMKRRNANFMEDQLKETEKLYATRRGKSEFEIHFKASITITLNITENYGELCIAVKSIETLDKINDLRRFFGSLKRFFRNYSLRYRIHLLEKQLL